MSPEILRLRWGAGPHTPQFNNGPLLSCALLQASSRLAGEDSSDSCYGTDEH